MATRYGYYDRVVGGLSRRELLNIAWRVGLAAVFAPAARSEAFAQPVFRENPFTLGVASGDPWPASVVLWTRLAPDPFNGGGMPTANVAVAWELARDEAFRTIVRAGRTIARPELGHSVHAEVDGLEPGRDYWYRFNAGGVESSIGRTRTAPAAGTAVDAVRPPRLNHHARPRRSSLR